MWNPAKLVHSAHVDVSFAANCRAIVYNPRGTAGTPVATPHFYSASYTADLRAVINSLQQQYPCTPLVACGYSLGANILCRSAPNPLVGSSSLPELLPVCPGWYPNQIGHVNCAGTWVRRAVAHR
jgi:predicted alpha/beta hydrolase